MSIFKKPEKGFLAKLFKHKQVEELAEELAHTYAGEMQADMLSDNSETDTAEDTAAEPVPMLEVTESGEVDFTEPSETTEGESPPQDTEPSEVRKHLITFRVNDMELEAINRRYAETSFRSRGDFCRYSALTVMNVEEDTEDIKQIARYISSISSSFNQVAHRVNKGGKLYDEDIADMKARLEEVWQLLVSIRSTREHTVQLLKLNASAINPKPEPSAPTPQPTPTESKAPEKKEDVWAEIRGMRDSDEMIAELEAGGITSLDDLRGFFWNFKHPDDHTDELAELDKKIRGIDKLINMMKQHSQNYATYKEYQERSAFTQKHFRKKNAAAIDAFEEADKYIAEHIKHYYIKGKPPKLNDLQAKSTKLKEKYNALVPEHNAFVTKRDTAHKYTRQVRNYLQSKEQQERNRQYQEKKRTQQRKKETLE